LKLVAQSLGCCHWLRMRRVPLILEPGDLLIAYTDGISEAMTAEDEEWGEDRMLEAVPRRATASASEVLEEIFRAADVFTAGAEQHDDMTLLVMKLVES
jgi:phosphoserine phosphatase RsbU/P